MAMAMAFPSLPLVPSPARPIPPHCHRSPSRPLVCCQLFQRLNRRRLPGLWTEFVELLALPNQATDTGSKGDSRLEDPSPGNSSSSLLGPNLWPRFFNSLVRPKENSHREGKGKDGLTDPISGNGSSRGLERCTLRHTGKDRWRRPKWLLVWNSREVREIWALLLQLGVVLLFMRFTGLLALPTSRTERRIEHSSECSVSTSNVPFSEFLCGVQQGHVQSVEIDGVHFRYSLRFTQPRPELQVGRTDLESNVSREKYDCRIFLDPGGDFLALQPFCYDQVSTRSILYTTIKPYDMVTPYERMIKNGVDFQVPDKRATNLINSFGLPCLYVGLLATLSIQIFSSVLQSTAWPLMGRRFYKRGRKKAKKDSVTFADVAGVDEAKEELEEVVDYLRNPQRYSRLGASPPRGVLLVGPPGTGKTLLARAVSGEADVPFISCAGSEFVEMYVGKGASRVRELFAKAKEEAPSIIFIDEIDAVAKGRGDGRMLGFASDEREQTLNQLLTELDGFERSSMVIVLAATNRADVLDPALRRPGRFDRIVMVDPPDKLGREKVLQVHVSKKQVPLAENVDLEMVAAATSGFTGGA